MSMTLLLIGIGAGLMYFLDPHSGAPRRLWLREKWARTTKKEQASLAGAEASSDRVAGAGADDISFAAPNDVATDDELARRVRLALERALPQPPAVEVIAHHGLVILNGQVSAEEQDTVLACVRAVPGVKEVENRIEVRTAAGNA
ncbi:MAG: BON domain-containing protein [Pseudomonadota bacterium]|nr:BON domain-containing protein [Pseudomonadota bacterium]